MANDFAFNNKDKWVVDSGRHEKGARINKIEGVHDDKDSATKHAAKLRRDYRKSGSDASVGVADPSYTGGWTSDPNNYKVGRTVKTHPDGRKEVLDEGK